MPQNGQTYLVGGAVRDKLLGLKVHDKDFVVVGSTPEQMLAQGFQAVGKDFPVFLHPKTHQEFALARTERKSGHGYTGFECHFSQDVTLEEDLIRRDLTINAIAESESGELIDPYGGQKDLECRTLRHVSDAFIEDPLRVLRVARFAAKLAPLGFTIADETLELMRQIAHSGELDHLTPERVWQEWYKSLVTDSPHTFLQVLRDCDALKVVLPEFDQLFGVPQPEIWHPEIDTGIHTLMVAEQAALMTSDPVIRFCAQVHDLGKGITPKEEWPSHKMHGHTGQRLIKALCERIRVPNDFRDAAVMVCAEHTNVHRADELKPTTFVKVFNRIDVWRKPVRFEQLMQSCCADHRGRTGFEGTHYPQQVLFETAYAAASQVEVKAVVADGFKGPAIREELDKRRAAAIATALNR
ncbi:multifunctional CCA addition/repair protein [Vibrio sp. SCSIO 43136]|uniref:multifunctional CCA addition/repair protein n=1 Tax=Vibrio sp. SCSIO 43136 TaxID=2819101 RepID=UPI00207661B2|nr:multifunctional CCA addition/repair protein [Vibrio sp. SCSIO 43136]USD66714.1 multifunctional CCA addition/repair protein [Vibrio sp. SCSIO 43136]